MIICLLIHIIFEYTEICSINQADFGGIILYPITINQATTIISDFLILNHYVLIEIDTFLIKNRNSVRKSLLSFGFMVSPFTAQQSLTGILDQAGLPCWLWESDTEVRKFVRKQTQTQSLF